MINPKLLEILRCPLNPSQSALELDGNQLACRQCNVLFKIKDGIPNLVPTEAELPMGCEGIADLPCQRDAQPAS